MTIDKDLEKEIDSVLKNFKENLLIVHEYKQKRAKTANEMLEDYLCVTKEFELTIGQKPPSTSPISVGIRYDILEKAYTLPKKIQDLIDNKVNEQS